MILINENKYENCKSFLDAYSLNNIHNEKNIILIAEEDNQRSGYIIIDKGDELAEIKELFVLEEFRNMHLGDGLLRTALNFLRSKNINRVIYKENNSYLINKGFIEKKNFIECDIEGFFSNNICKR